MPLYPTPSCTGVPLGTVLTTITGTQTITTDGTQIVGKRILGNVEVRANNVVIRNSEITGTVVNWNGAGGYKFLIEDSTVGAATGCKGAYSDFAIGVDNYTARRVLVRGFPDGFRLGGPKGAVIQDSYVTVCSEDPADHSDGVQAYGAGGLNVVQHTVFDQTPVTNGAETSPIFIAGPESTLPGVSFIIKDNVAAGGGYSVRIENNAPEVTGNKAVAGTWGYGAFDVRCSQIGKWEDNGVVTFDFATGAVLQQLSTSAVCDG